MLRELQNMMSSKAAATTKTHHACVLIASENVASPMIVFGTISDLSSLSHQPAFPKPRLFAFLSLRNRLVVAVAAAILTSQVIGGKRFFANDAFEPHSYTRTVIAIGVFVGGWVAASFAEILFSLARNPYDWPSQSTSLSRSSAIHMTRAGQAAIQAALPSLSFKIIAAMSTDQSFHSRSEIRVGSSDHPRFITHGHAGTRTINPPRCVRRFDFKNCATNWAGFRNHTVG